MTFKTNILLATAALTFATGCADHPDKIQAQYISPMQYENYSCKQMSAELQRLSSKVSQLYGQQENASNNSDAVMGVGLVLFWPALFFLDSHSAQAAEYSRIKGEFDAVEQAAIKKNCGLKIEKPVLKQPEPKEEKPAYPG